MASKRILVVEGNTPEVSNHFVAAGGAPAAEGYAAAILRLAPEIDIEIMRPLWPGFDAGSVSLDAFDGAALTGSGVAFSADMVEAKPARDLLERIFAAKIPTFGSCWGLHLGAVVLGGSVRASPNGIELGVARGVRVTEAGAAHPLHDGRGSSFDTVCIHRDEVHTLPTGAVLTAENAHSPQAMTYELGGVSFWGVQYHPELSLADIAVYIARDGENALFDPTKFESAEVLAQVVRDFWTIANEPLDHPALLWRYGVQPEVAMVEARTRELQNWLAGPVGARASHGGVEEMLSTDRLMIAT